MRKEKAERPLPQPLHYTAFQLFALRQWPMNTEQGLADPALGTYPGLSPLCHTGSGVPESSCPPSRLPFFPAGWMKGQPHCLGTVQSRRRLQPWF